jgi:hypothetical protein
MLDHLDNEAPFGMSLTLRETEHAGVNLDACSASDCEMVLILTERIRG